MMEEKRAVEIKQTLRNPETGKLETEFIMEKEKITIVEKKDRKEKLNENTG